MSTGVTLPDNPEITVKGHGPKQPTIRSNRYFFPAMAVLILAGVVLGFAETYYLAGVFLAPLPNWLIHVHGAVFTTWILLLIVQTSLVLGKRRRLAPALGHGRHCTRAYDGCVRHFGCDRLVAQKSKRDGNGRESVLCWCSWRHRDFWDLGILRLSVPLQSPCAQKAYPDRDNCPFGSPHQPLALGDY